MKKIFDQIPFFAISKMAKWPNIHFWTVKKFKTAKNAISHKKNLMDIFDFTTFFAWTFLNFLARCVLGTILHFLTSNNPVCSDWFFHFRIIMLNNFFRTIFNRIYYAILTKVDTHQTQITYFLEIMWIEAKNLWKLCVCFLLTKLNIQKISSCSEEITNVRV